jgi:hypothetical protein
LALPQVLPLEGGCDEPEVQDTIRRFAALRLDVEEMFRQQDFFAGLDCR